MQEIFFAVSLNKTINVFCTKQAIALMSDEAFILQTLTIEQAKKMVDELEQSIQQAENVKPQAQLIFGN